MAARKFPSLRQFVKEPPSRGKALSVCVVTSEFLGPIKNGGIGTATSGLIEHLNATGHRVTVLYTQVFHSVPHCSELNWDYWVNAFQERGIELQYIPHTGAYSEWREKAWLVKDFLGERPFDLVYFNEHHGSGYYALSAKKAGIEPFASQLQCLITHGSIEWVSNINDQPLQTERDLEMAVLERRSVEMADFIIAPSAYLLNEYASYGWHLPPNTLVQPYVLRKENLPPPPLTPIPVSEIVFFGRLEVRKGLWVFCEALDRIKDRIGGIPVTFLGRMTDLADVPTGQYLLSRAINWNFNFQIVTSAGQSEALERLRKPGRLAVMPSTADNSPCVVYECLENRIPFITGAGTGADEIVDKRRSPWALVEPTTDALAAALVDAIENGARPALPAFDYEENWAAWETWHRWVSANERLKKTKPARSRSRKADTKALLIFDNGETPFTELVGSIIQNGDRLQKGDGVILLSQRRPPLLRILETIIAETARIRVASPRFTFLSIHDGGAEEVLHIISGHRTLIGFDLGLEINSTFIANADRALAHEGADAMVCACRDEETNALRLPFGSAGGIAILSEEVSAGVWAINLQKTKDIMRSVPIIEESQNLLYSAREFGEILLRRICIADGKVALDTNVGGVAISSARRVNRNTHTWYRRTLNLVDDIGLNSFAGISLPTWQIVSVAAQKRAKASLDRENVPALITQAVNAEYPRVGGGAAHEIMAKRAAFFGDLAQGIQVLAANGPVQAKTQMDLIGTALAERLRSTPFRFQALDSWPGLFTLDVDQSYGFVPTPTGFILHPNQSGAKQATVIVAAVPLQRYHALKIGLRLPDEAAVADVKLSLSVFEELGGHEIARQEFIVTSQEWQEVALPLPPIAGSAVFHFLAELASSRPVADFCALELSDFKFQRAIQ
jgi:glycosyltransferase involved in cell wall biosynthesis